MFNKNHIFCRVYAENMYAPVQSGNFHISQRMLEKPGSQTLATGQSCKQATTKSALSSLFFSAQYNLLLN